MPLVAIPLGLIAVSSWLVKLEGDSFLHSQRTALIQQQAKNVANRGVSVEPVASNTAFTHDRFGWKDDSNQNANTLGTTLTPRGIGSRTGAPPSWIDTQAPVTSESRDSLPPIPGYIENGRIGASPYATVPEGSGFHITADEATKLDVNGNKVIFNGNVSLTSPQFDLSGDQLVVFLSEDKKTFRLAEATGSVQVQLKKGADDKCYRGQSDKAVYEPAKGTIVMTGWPKIQGQGQELIAAAADTRVMLYPNTGKLLTEGRTQTRVARQLVADDSAKRDTANSGE
jgi:lipopolysaccharide transport protein LptA